MLPSRKERRIMARKFGLIKENETHKEWLTRLSRSIKAGEAIHQANLQEFHNQLIKQKNNSAGASDNNQ